MDNNILTSLIENKKPLLTAISDQIWEFAEPAFDEHRSMQLQANFLEEQGFAITKALADIPTAFKASYGKGKPVIAILGEYDALPTMSQKADCLTHEPLKQGAWGHGCGHHLLGTACMQAAIAIKDYIEKNPLAGTVVYYGCPAEEGEAAKAFMVKAGCFDDCDVALSWHPYSMNAGSSSTLSNARVRFNFYGISSHAAVSPHLGRSALDAVELMNVGVNYMREHMPQQCRVHYAITNSGGNAPNVVQSEAEVLYAIRAAKNSDTISLVERVSNIARGAAMMTETRVEISINSAFSDVVQNKTLDNLVFKNMKELLPTYTPEELSYAQKFRELADQTEINTYKQMARKLVGDKADALMSTPMAAFVIPPMDLKQGSTDVGDVSQIIPTSLFMGSCYAMGTSVHSWQAVAQGKSSIAHKGMTFAASVIAKTALELMENPSLIEEAKSDFNKAMDGKAYRSILPKDCIPRILRNK